MSPEGLFRDEPDELPDVPYHCEHCGTCLSIPANSLRGRCRADNCVTLLCRDCGREWGSFGPVGCPCQDRHPTLRKIRIMYQRRKR